MRFSIKSIRGSLEAPRGARALVIMVHGAGASKDWGFFPWLAEVLCDEGFAVCRFDMSRPEDLARVVQHCQNRVALPTFLFSHADGAATAIAEASHVPNLRGVIAWSAKGPASKVDVPLLLIDGEKPSAEIDALDVSRVVIKNADASFNATDPLKKVPRELMLAADLTARFVGAYS